MVARPLVLTTDEVLLDDLLRLAHAAGAEVEVAADPGAARRSFTRAPLVLVGDDQVEALARARLPRRDAVVLVGPSASPEAARQVGAEHIAVLPQASSWLVDRLTDPPEPVHRARTVAVLGGCGGAGASVLAAGLAVTAARVGCRVLLVDADPYGGGLEALLGPPTGPGDLVLLTPQPGDVPSGALPRDAMDVCLDVGRQGRDVVVLDLPRRIDDAAVAALGAADDVYLVVPAEPRACVAAGKVAAVAASHTRRLAVVVRDPGRGPLAAHDVARNVRLPLAGTLRSTRELRRGRPGVEAPVADGRGPLATLCRRLLALPVPPYRDAGGEATA